MLYRNLLLGKYRSLATVFRVDLLQRYLASILWSPERNIGRVAILLQHCQLHRWPSILCSSFVRPQDQHLEFCLEDGSSIMCLVDIVGVGKGQEPLKYAAYLVWFILVVMSSFCYRTFGFTLLCSYHCSVQCLRGVSLPLVRFVLRWGHTPFMLRYFGFHRSAKA